VGVSDERGSSTYRLEVGRQMAACLVPTIERIVRARKLTVKEMDYFACGIGPGSFTGIRVGLAAMKACAWACKKPIIPLPTLDTIAQNACSLEGTVVPIVDAKRDLLYCCAYRVTAGCVKRIMPYRLLSEDEFFRTFKRNIVVFGDGLMLHKESIKKKIRGVTILDKDYWYPKPEALLSVADERIRRRKYTDAFKLTPLYLYARDCQINKKK
jgi:tRNA threonylcarbamoyladenosine biosynthesis protein TsaB